jgi:hypothetical protein
VHEHDLRNELDQTMALFRERKYLPGAEPKYGILQDAIFWEDEFPREAQFCIASVGNGGEDRRA